MIIAYSLSEEESHDSIAFMCAIRTAIWLGEDSLLVCPALKVLPIRWLYTVSRSTPSINVKLFNPYDLNDLDIFSLAIVADGRLII
jgi:hypothetical protein